MVRLKPGLEPVSYVVYGFSLNSTMVRLKPAKKLIMKVKNIEWSQFHYGSIKTMAVTARMSKF